MEEVMAGHLNDSLLLLKFQKTHGALELSLGATDDCSGEALHDSLGSWRRQVVFPVYQSQVLKVHPIKEGSEEEGLGSEIREPHIFGPHNPLDTNKDTCPG